MKKEKRREEKKERSPSRRGMFRSIGKGNTESAPDQGGRKREGKVLPCLRRNALFAWAKEVLDSSGIVSNLRMAGKRRRKKKGKPQILCDRHYWPPTGGMRKKKGNAPARAANQNFPCLREKKKVSRVRRQGGKKSTPLQRLTRGSHRLSRIWKPSG